MRARWDWFGAACMGTAAGIWGATFVASKVAMTVVPAFVLISGRFALAWLVLRMLMRVRGQSPVPGPHTWIPAMIGMVGMVISIGAQFTGTALTSASQGALVTAASPALMALFAALILKERLTLHHGVAITVATVGVLVMTGIGSPNWEPLGNTLLALAAVTWALYSVLTRWASRHFDPMAVLAGASGWGAIGSLPFVTWDWPYERLFSWDVGGSVLFIIIVSTLIAFALWSWGCARLPARVGGLFFFVQPLIGTILGTVLLGEQPGYRFYGGGILVLVGVALAQAADQAMTETSGEPA